MNIQKIENFSFDKKVEEQVAGFLDENFYSQLSAKAETFGRSNELSDQYLGIDLSVGNALVDEKVKNARSPNRINNYWSSIEIFQKKRNGDYDLGWFADPRMKTTHYAYLYNFQDSNGETSSVVMAWFKKSELKEMIEQQVGFHNVIDDARSMEYAKKGIDDIRYEDPLGHTIWKLTKSCEGATVLTVTLEDLSYLKHTKFLKVSKGRKIQRLKYDDLRKMFN